MSANYEAKQLAEQIMVAADDNIPRKIIENARGILRVMGAEQDDFLSSLPDDAIVSVTSQDTENELAALLLPGAWKTIDSAPKTFGIWFEAWRSPATIGIRPPLVYVTWKQFEDGDSAWVWPDSAYEVFSEDGRERAEAMIGSGDHYEDVSFTHWREMSKPPHDELRG